MSFEQNNTDLSLADIHHEVLLQLEAIILPVKHLFRLLV